MLLEVLLLFLAPCSVLSLLAGLAETLRSEMLLYGIDIHILFPGTIYSPGYTEENKTKPKITLKIEETDEGGQPEYIARALLEGATSVRRVYGLN
jgi:3-dehydrosphinganine reductase